MGSDAEHLPFANHCTASIPRITAYGQNMKTMRTTAPTMKDARHERQQVGAPAGIRNGTGKSGAAAPDIKDAEMSSDQDEKVTAQRIQWFSVF